MDERRGYVRLTVDAQVSYGLKNKSAERKIVRLEDLSARGIRVLFPEPMGEGQLLDLGLKISGIPEEIRMIGKIVWQRRITPVQFDTGVEFVEISEESSCRLEEFIQEVAGKVEERREFVRCDLSVDVYYRILDSVEQKQVCKSLDISQRGLKLLLPKKLEKGTRLEISFLSPEDSAEVLAKCTVVAWAKKGEEDLFETGIEFLEIGQNDLVRIKNYIQKKIRQKEAGGK